MFHNTLGCDEGEQRSASACMLFPSLLSILCLLVVELVLSMTINTMSVLLKSTVTSNRHVKSVCWHKWDMNAIGWQRLCTGQL